MTASDLRHLAEKVEFILGSASPRRRDLLRGTGISFRWIVPQVQELMSRGEPPFLFARRMAEQKALDVSTKVSRTAVVLGCDTVVVLDDRILRRPRDEHEAFSTLNRLSGREHIVCTSLALVSATTVLASGHELTRVFFNRVTSEQISEYIATGEPMDKAGAYGIQGMGAFLVDRIEGQLDNVVGLPRKLLAQLAGETLRKLEELDSSR